ncbi:MAG: hypothetical protein A2204_05715 [Elusimicrobia bacterium RIFOXYA1_FULL_47_7]|nr:MAG: hypothetical protein A2278_06430 [Elusimicrobia bacterium RIFOXYA12_FULL_49_49]OGS08777.1 MAG: hypothetical protein A2204_05715 [Elusimicrobia bacterium RIFOXYA1_FULL_47_7]OGS16475.1 MAG: hypothetical protein A2251_06595 [Elusimicrobia bacterium RIFOXYA2_FULL_47_53]OGS26020.1 MAG: hypothetical protein A2339_01290 [Elusimicrobia bacterium RIFOXYB12_FULL_50_12]OGS29636.1 MAG: hypothetical protein A2323_03545 [Elusimicrobia bacterium RIFOXYB2_FULL_46_23]
METLTANLNENQQQAALHLEGPLLIFAGAGTGKTRVITHRIANLISKGVHPSKILAVTFTNKAAEEMRRRVDELFPGRGRAVWISTFHSFGAQFLRVEAKNIGLNPEFLIYDTSDQKKVLTDCVKELNLDEKKFKPGRMIEVISRAKDELIDADSYGIHALTSGDYFRQISATIYGLYQKKLKIAGALDFGDLLMMTVMALRDNKTLLEKYQERFEYVLVDEYQDTNHAQYLLTKYISAKHKNICVVGDDDQSIYSWRGADIRNILEFERDYPSCKTVKLEKNYRSTGNILNGAWQVIKNNQNRVNKKVWTENLGGNPIKVWQTVSETEEAQSIASEILRLQRENDLKASDFAVFYRTNAQSRVLEDAFRRNGIEYAVIGSMRFYERAEVKDILCYLRLIHNPNDNVSFKRIINSPRRGIGKTSLEALERHAQGKSISLSSALNELAGVEITSGAKKAFAGFKTMMDSFIPEKAMLTVKEIATTLLDRTGYIRELEAENSIESKSKIENIFELISAIDEFERRSDDKTLAGYLTQVALVSDLDEVGAEKTQDRAILMTLHLAKGLEFKNVFISGLEEGLFPIGEAAFDRDDLEEERRLMYVGMTRAKENLYLSWAAERKVFGKSRWNMPSRFIEEAGLVAMPARGTGVSRGRAALNFDNSEPFDGGRGDGAVIKHFDPDAGSADEAYGGDSASGFNFAIGSRVRHDMFGSGKVIERSGSGENLKLVVLFDTGQWKKLVVKYANLEQIF